MTRARPFLLAALCALLPCLTIQAANKPRRVKAGVQVQKFPVVAESKTYDPANPAPEMMGAMPEGGGSFTAVTFPLAVNFAYATTQRPRNNGCRVTVTVHGVELKVGLNVVAWMPAGAAPGGDTEKFKSQQAGHRQVAEHFYKTAVAAAQAAGKKYDARNLPGEGPTCEEAVKQVLTAAAQDIAAAYEGAVTKRAGRARELYDEIAAGNPSLSVEAAVKQAVEREAAEWKQGQQEKLKAEREAKAKPRTPSGGRRTNSPPRR